VWAELRHINIRFFFMKDRVLTKGIDIKYCPTEQMLADFFTKPLQKALFMLFKCVVMGLDHIKSLWQPESNLNAEHVAKNTDLTQNNRKSQAANRPKPKVTFRSDICLSSSSFSSKVQGNATLHRK